MAARLPRFKEHRFVGDKATLVVHDLDDPRLDQGVVDALARRSGQLLAFAPDTLAEARNRGYRPARSRRHPRQA